MFGKFVLLLLVLSIFIYGGYFFGKRAGNIVKPEAVSVENEVIKDATTPPPPTVSGTLATVLGGVSKSAGLSFDQYSISTPEEWIAKKENQTVADEKLILTKDKYQINIFQAATGGALCLYPGDGDFEGPSSKFEIFTDLNTKDNRMLRRSGNESENGFTVCQKGQDGSYQQPTNYGHISITVPDNSTQEMMDEIDMILSSLKKI